MRHGAARAGRFLDAFGGAPIYIYLIYLCSSGTTTPRRVPSSRHDSERPHHIVVLGLDDVAVIDVVLGSRDAHPQLELGPDGGEVAGVRLDRVLEPRGVPLAV